MNSSSQWTSLNRQTSRKNKNVKISKNQGSWGVEPEFETELCDLKIEGGNQGELLFRSCLFFFSLIFEGGNQGELCWVLFFFSLFFEGGTKVNYSYLFFHSAFHSWNFWGGKARWVDRAGFFFWSCFSFFFSNCSNLRWWRKEGFASAERGDCRRGDACRRYWEGGAFSFLVFLILWEDGGFILNLVNILNSF